MTYRSGYSVRPDLARSAAYGPRVGERTPSPGEPPIDPYGDGVGPFLYPKPVKEIVYRDFGLFFREVLARARKENAPEPPEEGPDPFCDPVRWIR